MPGDIKKCAAAPWHLIRELAINGASLPQLAKQFDLNVSTVRARAARGKWNVLVHRLTDKRNRISHQERTAIEKTAQVQRDAFPVLGRQSRLAGAVFLRDTLNYLSSLSPKTKAKNSGQFRALIDAGSKLHNWNDSQSGHTIRFDFRLAPEKLAARLVESERISNTLPDSQSTSGRVAASPKLCAFPPGDLHSNFGEINS